MSGPTTFSIAFQTDKPLRHYGALARTAEQLGFDGVSVYNDMLFQPAWLPLREIARHTNRVRIGPAAVNPFTCHPIHIAGNISLLDEASGGRAYLGLARGAWLDFIGLQPEKPITALKEAILCIRHLLSQSREPLPGAFFPLAGGDTLRWSIRRSNIPFLLGSWGHHTIRTCGPLVDELKLGGTANADAVSWILEQLDTPRPDIVVGAVTVVAEDGAAARRLARREAALYLPVVAQLDPTLNIEPDRLDRIARAARDYDFETAAANISDDLLRRFAFAGNAAEVSEQAAELIEAGVERIEFGTPHGLTTARGLDLLGRHVLPLLRL